MRGDFARGVPRAGGRTAVGQGRRSRASRGYPCKVPEAGSLQDAQTPRRQVDVEMVRGEEEAALSLVTRAAIFRCHPHPLASTRRLGVSILRTRNWGWGWVVAAGPLATPSLRSGRRLGAGSAQSGSAPLAALGAGSEWGGR